jgi:hypothetical protein
VSVRAAFKRTGDLQIVAEPAAQVFSDHSLNDAVVPPPRHTRFFILVICAIFLPLCFFVIGAGNAWMTSDEEAMVTMERVSSLLHEHAVRSFETHEAMIMALDQRLSGLARSDISAQRDDLGAFVGALRHASPAVAGLAVVHAPAQVVLSSQSITVDAKPLSDPAAIKALRDQNRRIAVSKTSESDEQGASQFFLARRILLRGNEESLILSTFETSFFESFYDPLRRDAGDLIALVRDDGSVLARTHPGNETAEEANEPARILKKPMARTPRCGRLVRGSNPPQPILSDKSGIIRSIWSCADRCRNWCPCGCGASCPMRFCVFPALPSCAC